MAASAAAPAFILDLTRLVSRAGHAVDTGVDRVERAWLSWLMSRPGPVFALIRTDLGFLLLDRGGLAAALHLLRPQQEPRQGLLYRVFGRAAMGKARRALVLAGLRRRAVARCRLNRLGPMLRRFLPDGVVYLNTGHSNLDDSVFRAIHGVAGARCVVLVHDTIPLDHPDLCRAGTEADFARRLRAVGANADLAIYTTRAVAQAAERHLARWGRVPPAVIAPLGVHRVAPDTTRLTPHLPLDRPYFLALGTIEPRKNHALLLDVWADFHARMVPDDIPRLFILGARGWADAALLDRLDRLPFRNDTVFEVGGLPDGAVAALLDRSAGLLFPSLAEGFGLPPIEAAMAGVPVVCNDLPVYRETLGDYPVYVAVTDSYRWAQAITDLAQGHRASTTRFKGPDWADHFNRVLSRI